MMGRPKDSPRALMCSKLVAMILQLAMMDHYLMNFYLGGAIS